VFRTADLVRDPVLHNQDPDPIAVINLSGDAANTWVSGTVCGTRFQIQAGAGLP